MAYATAWVRAHSPWPGQSRPWSRWPGRFLSTTVGLGPPAYDIVKKPTPTRRYELWFLSKVVATPPVGAGSADLPCGERFRGPVPRTPHGIPAFAGMTVEGTPRGFDTPTHSGRLAELGEGVSPGGGYKPCGRVLPGELRVERVQREGVLVAGLLAHQAVLERQLRVRREVSDGCEYEVTTATQRLH